MGNKIVEEFPDEPRGYMPRKLNIYETQIVQDWHSDDVAPICDLVDGWIRTVAAGTDLSEAQIDKVVDKAFEKVTDCRERGLSAFAFIEEIRELMTEEGLEL